MTIQVPESYLAYCEDCAVRTAVDHVLGSKSLGVPADLDWNELPKFHEAVLSAYQVRCEYAIYLIDLWNCIWQPALDNCGFKVTPQTIAEMQQNEHKLDAHTVWDYWFFRNFRIRDDENSTLALYTCAESDGQIRLYLTFWSDQRDESRVGELDLGDEWDNYEDDENYVCTRRGLAPIGVNGTVALACLHTAAENALAAVGAAPPA